MKYRKPGNSCLTISVVGLEAKRFGSDETPPSEINRIIDHAL